MCARPSDVIKRARVRRTSGFARRSSIRPIPRGPVTFSTVTEQLTFTRKGMRVVWQGKDGLQFGVSAAGVDGWYAV